MQARRSSAFGSTALAAAFSLTIGASIVACGGSRPVSQGPVRARLAAPPAPPPEPGPRESIARATVDRTLRGGLGRFLRLLEVDAALDAKGKFQGWKIVALGGPKGTWDGVDLQAGDVVTRVNGFPLERDWQADKAFQSLAVASELRVSLLRAGKPLELRFAIVEDEAAPVASAASASPAR
jgi:hypothetical protein